MKDLEDQVSRNTNDISQIKQNITTIMTNHLFHIEKEHGQS
jgi:regulator of replication initiation timing